MVGYVYSQFYGLFTLLDPDPGMDIRPKNGYSNNLESGSRLESESESIWREKFLYSTMQPLGLESKSAIHQAADRTVPSFDWYNSWKCRTAVDGE